MEKKLLRSFYFYFLQKYFQQLLQIFLQNKQINKQEQRSQSIFYSFPQNQKKSQQILVIFKRISNHILKTTQTLPFQSNTQINHNKLNSILFRNQKNQKKSQTIKTKMKRINMRQLIKEGQMFKLGNQSKSIQQQNANENNHGFDKIATNQTEVEFQSFHGTGGDISNQDLMINNAGMIVCGCIVCTITTVICLVIFYYLFFDYVKDYIPDLPFINHAKINFLTEANAQEYFNQHPLYAGEIHYSRIPVQYWNHRIQMVKSMGLNALSVYVFWNHHQIQKGNFDFQTGNKNLPYFLDLAKQHNMTVLLRPGPYVCAQWDFGGLPARLLGTQGMKIRSSNELFINESKIYFEQLSKVIRKYIRNKANPQGSILMIQVQNQPGFYANQKLYIDKLKQIWDNLMIGCPLYFDDSLNNLGEQKMYWDNAILGINVLWYQKQKFKQFNEPTQFGIGGQIYSGWFSNWIKNQNQQNRVNQAKQKFGSQFISLFEDKKSFSMYMAHGGTNFGLTAGYNIITSYDYFAPVNEQGSPSEKYYIFRSIVSNFSQNSLPSIPNQIPAMAATLGETKAIGSLFDNLPEPVSFEKAKSQPLPFESDQLKMFKQGIVIYETLLKGPKNYTFDCLIHDIGIAYLDGIKIALIERTQEIFKQQNFTQLNVNCENKQCTLSILVEAMGHINFGPHMAEDKKGLIQFRQKNKDITLVNQNNLSWKYYKFQVQNQLKWKNTQKCTKAPCLYLIQANLTENKDTYINVKGLKKGYIWVNGHNLGRYWDIGPQHKLYCPGVWLNKGNNKILILDLFVTQQKIKIVTQKKLY